MVTVKENGVLPSSSDKSLPNEYGEKMYLNHDVVHNNVLISCLSICPLAMLSITSWPSEPSISR